MYKSLDDFDVVNGIFSLTMGQRKENRKALQYEASGHYFDAYELYNEVFLISIPFSLLYKENISVYWIFLYFIHIRSSVTKIASFEDNRQKGE